MPADGTSASSSAPRPAWERMFPTPLAAALGGVSHTPGYHWLSEVAPRLGCAGGVIGLILVNSTMPQVVKTSGGRMPKLGPAVWGKMVFYITPKAGGLKAVQYGVMREMKLTLDKVVPPGIATMLSFGIVGTFFQSIIYNTLIADMYKIHMGKEKERLSLRALARGLAPGFVWCFARESGAMGGGLWLGPPLKAEIEIKLKERGIEVPEQGLRFLGGFCSGAFTAIATQWLHNTTLYAGRMAATNEVVGAPFYTGSSIKACWGELGYRMFYSNYPQRMTLIAGAVALLNMLDIFHRPDLIMTKMF